MGAGQGLCRLKRTEHKYPETKTLDDLLVAVTVNCGQRPAYFASGRGPVDSLALVGRHQTRKVHRSGASSQYLLLPPPPPPSSPSSSSSINHPIQPQRPRHKGVLHARINRSIDCQVFRALCPGHQSPVSHCHVSARRVILRAHDQIPTRNAASVNSSLYFLFNLLSGRAR